MVSPETTQRKSVASWAASLKIQMEQMLDELMLMGPTGEELMEQALRKHSEEDRWMMDSLAEFQIELGLIMGGEEEDPAEAVRLLCGNLLDPDEALEALRLLHSKADNVDLRSRYAQAIASVLIEACRPQEARQELEALLEDQKTPRYWRSQAAKQLEGMKGNFKNQGSVDRLVPPSFYDGRGTDRLHSEELQFSHLNSVTGYSVATSVIPELIRQGFYRQAVELSRALCADQSITSGRGESSTSLHIEALIAQGRIDQAVEICLQGAEDATDASIRQTKRFARAADICQQAGMTDLALKTAKERCVRAGRSQLRGPALTNYATRLVLVGRVKEAMETLELYHKDQEAMKEVVIKAAIKQEPDRNRRSLLRQLLAEQMAEQEGAECPHMPVVAVLEADMQEPGLSAERILEIKTRIDQLAKPSKIKDAGQPNQTAAS